MSVARHPRSPELENASLEEVMDSYVARFRDRTPDWTDDDGGGEWENRHQSGGGTFDDASSGPRVVSGPSSSNSEASIRLQVASHE